MTEVGAAMNRRLSPSRASLLLPPSCPAKFKQAHDFPPPPSAVFDLGHLAHKLVLGKGDDIEVIDAANYQSAGARMSRDAARADGRIPALPHELANAELMAQAVHAHPIAGHLLDYGDPEVTLSGTDKPTGVELSGRADWITLRGERVCFIEYKTALTAQPDAWARKAADFGYVLQQAWYVELGRQMGMDDAPGFLFIVQEKTPPHLVSVVELDSDAQAYGRRLMRRALDLFARCHDTDEWPGYDEIIHTTSLPGWIYKQEEYR